MPGSILPQVSRDMVVEIIRSKLQKKISVRVLKDLRVRVCVPFYYPEAQVAKLLKDHSDWIQKQQNIIAKNKSKIVTNTNIEILYLGKKYPVVISLHQKHIIELSDKLYFGSTNLKHFHKYVTGWYKENARKLIVERTNLYAKREGITFSKIGLTEASTRWGSCSSEKSLHFNWKLILAPLPVMDYVIVHELSHLHEMNHSVKFWETVRSMFPLYRQYRTWLKRNGHTLIVPTSNS